MPLSRSTRSAVALGRMLWQFLRGARPGASADRIRGQDRTSTRRETRTCPHSPPPAPAATHQTPRYGPRRDRFDRLHVRIPATLYGPYTMPGATSVLWCPPRYPPDALGCHAKGRAAVLGKYSNNRPASLYGPHTLFHVDHLGVVATSVLCPPCVTRPASVQSASAAVPSRGSREPFGPPLLAVRTSAAQFPTWPMESPPGHPRQIPASADTRATPPR